MFAQIIPAKANPNTDKLYTYLIPDEILNMAKIGSQVIVPFGKRNIIGYIASLSDSPPAGIKNIKQILEIRDDIQIFSEDDASFARWIADYYLSYYSSAIRLFFPPGMKKFENINSKKKNTIGIAGKKIPLEIYKADNYLEADKAIKNKFEKIFEKLENAFKKNENPNILILGDSHSDIIAIYIESIKCALKNNKGAIILFPELDNNDRIIGIFKESFGHKLAILHSNMTEKNRFNEWLRIFRDEACVVLGTRSALFAPLKNPGLIIIDEEHAFTYKQEQNPKYHARDAAKYLAGKKKIPLIMSSGAPSVESFYSAVSANTLFDISGKDDTRPKIQIIDMKDEKNKNYSVLSNELMSQLESCLLQKKQAVLFMNRRGYHPCLICRQCGEIIKCKNCSISLVYHEFDKKLHCHRCGETISISFTCPNCLSSAIKFLGSGTQKIESEIAAHFPKAKILRIDRDSVTGKKYWDTIIEMFLEGDADILIGTQMILKALYHKSVHLLGVVSADNSLDIPDFRSAENTFQILSEICGFSGRHIAPENVIIQTYNPDHYSIKSVQENNYRAFYEKEISQREENKYPPFGRLINITISGIKTDIVSLVAQQLFEKIRSKSCDIEILGPAQTAVSKVRGATRWQILIKGINLDIIKKDLKEIISSNLNRQIRISIDVDPISI